MLTDTPKIQCPKEVRLRSHGETRRVDQQKPRTQMKMQTKKNYEVNCGKMFRNGCRISRRIWWIRTFNHINTLPAPVMSTVFVVISRKTEIATSVRRPKLQGLLAKDVLVQSCPERIFLVIYYPRITKFSVKDVNPDTIIDTLLRYKIWQLSDYNLTRVKLKLLRKPRRAYRSSWSQRGNQKSFTLTFPQNLASPVKNYPGIIVRQHHTYQKQMGLLREQCVE